MFIILLKYNFLWSEVKKYVAHIWYLWGGDAFGKIPSENRLSGRRKSLILNWNETDSRNWSEKWERFTKWRHRRQSTNRGRVRRPHSDLIAQSQRRHWFSTQLTQEQLTGKFVENIVEIFEKLRTSFRIFLLCKKPRFMTCWWRNLGTDISQKKTVCLFYVTLKRFCVLCNDDILSQYKQVLFRE